MIKLTQPADDDNEIPKRAAFPQPGKDDTIYYDWDTPGVGYFAHLVRVLKYDGSAIMFQGANLQEPDRTSDNPSYSLRLTDLQNIWWETPSSLEGWDEKVNNWAVLLLSDKFVKQGSDGVKAQLLAARADPGNKWPRGAGDKFLERYDEVVLRLQSFSQTAELRANETLYKSFMSTFGDLIDAEERHGRSPSDRR